MLHEVPPEVTSSSRETSAQLQEVYVGPEADRPPPFGAFIPTRRYDSSSGLRFSQPENRAPVRPRYEGNKGREGHQQLRRPEAEPAPWPFSDQDGINPIESLYGTRSKWCGPNGDWLSLKDGPSPPTFNHNREVDHRALNDLLCYEFYDYTDSSNDDHALRAQFPHRKGYSAAMFRTRVPAEVPTLRIRYHIVPPTFYEFIAVRKFIATVEGFESLFIDRPPSKRLISKGILRHGDTFYKQGIIRQGSAISYSKWFPVKKEDNFFRLVQGLRALNASQCRPFAMHLPGLHFLIVTILSFAFGLQVDLKAFYYLFELAFNIHPYFGCLAANERGSFEEWLLTVLPMGWKFACATGQRFSNGLCREATRRSPSSGLAIPWVDNIFLLADADSGVYDIMHSLLSVCHDLAVTDKKGPRNASQYFDGIGMSFDLKDKRVRLMPKIIAKVASSNTRYYSQSTKRNFLRVAGVLMFAVFATVRTPLSTTSYLLDALRRACSIDGHDMDDTFPLSYNEKKDLASLVNTVSKNPWWYLQEFEVPEPDVVIWADASEEAAAFVIERGGQDILFKSTPFPLDMTYAPMFYKELWSSVWAMKEARQLLRVIPRGTYEIGDNVGAVQVLKKGHGWGHFTNNLIQEWLEASQGNATNVWISTHKMRADSLTRTGKVPGPPIPVLDWSPYLQWTIPKARTRRSSI